MTSWKPDLSQADEPLYLEIAAALGRDIDHGVLAPGARLPTHRELARSLRVNVGTITRAYAEAARRGLIEGEVGRGSFVRHSGARALLATPPAPVPGDVVDLAFNLPAGGPSDDERRAALFALAERDDLDDCFRGYHLGGLARHREAGARWLERAGVRLGGERVLVTGGAQHALAIALATATQPGDVLLTEALTYPGIKSLARILGLRVHPVTLDEHGLVPDALEEACQTSDARALYCQPTSSNPTAISLDAARRRAIAAIARRRGLALIEDDTYGFVQTEETPALAVLAPERTWFVTGVSKSICSGPRVGFLALPSEPAGIAERALASVMALGWTASPIAAELVSTWIENGVAERVVQEKRAEALARQDLARRALAPLESPSEKTSCHLWLPLPEPWRASDFVARARHAGVAVTAAEAFAVGRASAPHAVRVCISTPQTREELARGLGVLASVLASTPSSAATVL
jgi:DNA-binding transcriptional MocR family regulator